MLAQTQTSDLMERGWSFGPHVIINVNDVYLLYLNKVFGVNFG